jgi:hypothetical protein
MKGIKTDFKGIVCDAVDWIHMAQEGQTILYQSYLIFEFNKRSKMYGLTKLLLATPGLRSMAEVIYLALG